MMTMTVFLCLFYASFSTLCVAVGLGGQNSDSEPLSLVAKRVASLLKGWQAEAPAKAFKVRVPAGLKSGQQFEAGNPSYGQMLVTVPKGAAEGQVVVFQVPAMGTEIKDRQYWASFYSRANRKSEIKSEIKVKNKQAEANKKLGSEVALEKATSVLAAKASLLKAKVHSGPRAAHLVSSSEGVKAAAPVSEAAKKEFSEHAHVLAEEYNNLSLSIPSARTVAESAKVVKAAASAGRSIEMRGNAVRGKLMADAVPDMHTDHLRIADKNLNMLAIHILQHGATMPESKMADLLMDWRNSPDTMSGILRETAQATLARDHHIVTMLAPKKDTQLSKMLDIQMLPDSEDRGDASLCGKKDIIITKFDDLLKKLMGQENAINAELAAVCLPPSATATTVTLRRCTSLCDRITSP
jgi:hypothetical protein